MIGGFYRPPIIFFERRFIKMEILLSILGVATAIGIVSRAISKGESTNTIGHRTRQTLSQTRVYTPPMSHPTPSASVPKVRRTFAGHTIDEYGNPID